jgi:hypothetical protein
MALMKATLVTVEDRDLELKLTKLCDLRVADTASVVPDCVVLHLTHNTRDGYEQHGVNRKRFLRRQAAAPASLEQERWGEFPVLWAARTLGRTAPKHSTLSLRDSLAPQRCAAEPLSFHTIGESKERTLYMIISCAAYADRQDLLRGYYQSAMPKSDAYVFVVGGAQRNHYDVANRTLHLSVGDNYEDLPEKVLSAVKFCAENFDFANLVKVDDDVIVNFRLASKTIRGITADYFGKMIPSRRGAVPSSTWHIGKVSDRSPFHDKPFSFDGGPSNWCCGGMYYLSRRAACELSQLASTTDTTEFLYEDHMVGTLLARREISPEFIEEHEALRGHAFVQTDLREILDAPMRDIEDIHGADSTCGVHCGPFPPLYSITKDKCLSLMSLFASYYMESAREKSEAREGVMQ